MLSFNVYKEFVTKQCIIAKLTFICHYNSKNYDEIKSNSFCKYDSWQSIWPSGICLQTACQFLPSMLCESISSNGSFLAIQFLESILVRIFVAINNIVSMKMTFHSFAS